MNLKYSEFLLKLSFYITHQDPYLCLHLTGAYLKGVYRDPGYDLKTEEYVELITSPAHKKHRTRLKTTITCKINNYNKLYHDNVTTLTIPLREQNFRSRNHWLETMAEIAESKGN